MNTFSFLLKLKNILQAPKHTMTLFACEEIYTMELWVGHWSDHMLSDHMLADRNNNEQCTSL